ncbi:MAG: 50S ribosomal protein L28 [Deltaproteobacteria bacterium]|nr:50S ribosomal protein L28 [Deltaproteobacteria bacterium]
MSRRCTISGKKPLNGHKVSHANKKANKISYVNLQSKRLYDADTKQWVRVRVSTRMLRTISKKGLTAALRDYGMTVADLK